MLPSFKNSSHRLDRFSIGNELLPVKKLEVRKATPNKSLRITWDAGKSSLEVNFYSKGAGKSQVVVQHSRLAGAKAVQRSKTFWGARLAALKTYLEK